MSDLLDVNAWTAEKLRWQFRVLRDPLLSLRAKLLGALLTHDFNYREGGFAWRGQGGPDGLAERLGYRPRNVQLAAQELERAGFLRIERGQGRGHSNRYWPVFEKARQSAPIGEDGHAVASLSPSQTACRGEHFEGEKACLGAENGARQRALFLEDSNTSPLPPPAADVGTSVGLAGTARTACAVPKQADAGGVCEVPAAIRDELDRLLGTSWVASYIQPSSYDPDTSSIHPRTAMARGRIDEAAGHHLRDLGVSLGQPMPPHLVRRA